LKDNLQVSAVWDFPQRVSEDAVELATKSERVFKLLVMVDCGWSWIEVPLELGSSIDSSRLLVLVASTVLMSLIGVVAIADLRFARQVFTFICGVGVLAIVPALPTEYQRSVVIALFSTVECFGKTACVAAFAVASLCERWSYYYQELLCQTIFLPRPRRAVVLSVRQRRPLPRLH
jgi:hypothetical protein